MEGSATAYELMHLSGLDFGPYVRLYERVRDRITGGDAHAHPALPTFEDGVANMAVLDAIRESARRRTRIEVRP
jgi:predicted dehydrogenase